MEVQSFEITIRMLGGLISAYQLDGNRKFLALANDLGKRLLPVFNTPTGMPCRYVNLQTGKIRDSINNPAEIGTALVEFGMLSQLTGKPEYYQKPKRALVELFKRRSKIGLVGSTINVMTGEWVDTTSHIGGGIDSYYEYLLKSWRLFGDKDCKAMWDSSIAAVNKYVADTTGGALWYGQVGMNGGKRLSTEFGSLEAFFPAELALSGDLKRAKALEISCFDMWNLNGIEPEEIDYSKMKVTEEAYILRPEIIESAYYLYHYTHDPTYRVMGRDFYDDLVKYCRTDSGYAALKSVVTKEKLDRMDSFFLAETLKYLYLLFAPDSAFPFDEDTFNTEAHPMRPPDSGGVRD
jgi:mannosidase alpha-like ER degradation enhancer 2